jgi:hypothetical protein
MHDRALHDRTWALPARILGTSLAALLLGAFVLGLFPVGLERAGADGGWWGDLDKGMNVRLADVLESPERFRGRSLTFACIFHQPEREFNPLRTRFNAERYDNVSVWPDGAAIWAKAEFVRDFPFLYIARSHPQHDLLLRQDMYTRIELTARIEAIIDGSPFLEVTGVRVTGHKLGARVMDAMLRGEVHGQSAGFESQTLAAQNFEAALAAVPDLAPIYVQRIRERLAQALTLLGRDEEAKRLLGPAAPLPLPAEAPAAAPAFPPAAPAGPIFDAPAVPPGGTLPGSDAPYGQAPHVQAPNGQAQPFPAPGSVPLEGSPDGDAPVASPPARPARGIQPRGPAPIDVRPAPAMPTGPIHATLPGVPTDNLPLPPSNAPGATRSAPSAATPTYPAAQGPRVVDPPLPAPLPGQGAPPRRPRLSGVK